MALSATRLNADTALPLRRQVGRVGAEQADALRHLSTGLRVSLGRDDPAALISGENLRSEGRKLDESRKNVDAAVALTDTADAALGTMLENLRDVGRLLSHSANLATAEERAANQLEVDKLLGNVDKLIEHTTHKGRPVFRDLPTPPAAPPYIDFSGSLVTPTAGNGQNGQPTSYAIVDGGRGIRLQGNARYAASVASYSVSPDTRARFRLDIADMGEYVGFVINDAPDTYTTPAPMRYKLAGLATQATTWNATYQQPGPGTYLLDIDLSPQAGQTIDHVHVVVDDDGGGSGDVTFRDIELYEDVPPPPSTSNTRTFALDPDAGRGHVTLGLPGLALNELGDVNAKLHELASGGTHDAESGRLVEAAGAVDAAIRRLAYERGRIGTFARLTLAATGRNLEVAGTRNAAATSNTLDAEVARQTAELARLDVLRQTAPDLMAAHRESKTRILDLLAG